MCKRSMVKTIHINNKNRYKDKVAACIGYFDGIHLGHQQLINKTIQYADTHSIRSALITFNPDPFEVINNKKSKHIFSDEKKKELIEKLGIDYLIIIDFDEAVMKKDPESFIKEYLKPLNIEYLVCGYDFRFAYKAEGNPKILKKHFKTEVVSEYKYYGKKVSTSRIKDNIIKGNFKLINRLLGFNYQLSLKVQKAQKTAKKWLIEAKIADSSILIPEDGDYLPYFKLKNGIFYLKSNKKYSKNDVIDIIFDE